MAKKISSISEKTKTFIEQQKIFFVATAGPEGRINLSPKGYDALRILNENQVVWLNLTGSGNETAAHLLENKRITLMFCAFEGKPLILRLYGYGRTIHERDSEWSDFVNLFPDYPGKRQFILVDVDLVQTSCGFGVPLFDFVDYRDNLTIYWEGLGPDGVNEFWKKHNQISLDKKPTRILA